MAQVVDYRKDHVTYTEGPFVICNALGNGWRIEVELKEYKCPVLPDASIYKMVTMRFGYAGKWHKREDAEKVCDWLNRMVESKAIVLDRDGWWVPAGETRCRCGLTTS